MVPGTIGSSVLAQLSKSAERRATAAGCSWAIELASNVKADTLYLCRGAERHPTAPELPPQMHSAGWPCKKSQIARDRWIRARRTAQCVTDPRSYAASDHPVEWPAAELDSSSSRSRRPCAHALDGECTVRVWTHVQETIGS